MSNENDFPYRTTFALSHYLRDIALVEVVPTSPSSAPPDIHRFPFCFLFLDKAGRDLITVTWQFHQPALPSGPDFYPRVDVKLDSADRRYKIVKRDRTRHTVLIKLGNSTAFSGPAITIADYLNSTAGQEALLRVHPASAHMLQLTLDLL